MPSISFTEHSLNGPDILLLDDPDRIKLHTSTWQGILHPIKKKRLDKQTQQAVFRFFQERYHVANLQHFERIWDELSTKVWSPSELLTVGSLRKIDRAFKQQLAYHGPGISSPGGSRNSPSPAIQLIVKSLLHGDHLTKDILHQPLVKAVMIKKDPECLGQFRVELQHELDNLAVHLPQSDSERILWEGFLGNIIALIPFCYPENNALISIPRLDKNGGCQKIDYRMETIELTPSDFVTPVSAVGFTAVNVSNASPMIAFLGTTYPAGDGFAASVFSDFTPGHSVGEATYHYGRDKIAGWLKDKQDVHAIGTSLGGALAFHTLRYHADKLLRVDVYNPPGLYENCWKDRLFDNGCEVNIYCQTGDLVSTLGSWPTGKNVKLYHVLQDHPGIKDGIASSHARAFTGMQKVTMLKKEPLEENQRIERNALTWLHRYIGPLLVFIPLALAFVVYRIFLALQNLWRSKKN